MAKHENHETGAPIEGNAAAALEAIGGVVPGFKSVNGETGKKWEVEGNAKEAVDSIGGIEHYGETSSIIAHGPVELPGNKSDRPKGGDGSSM